MSVPVVDGIAPELPFRAEIVGRHARDNLQLVSLAKQEELGVGPDVARVGRNEERQIADQLHALVMRVLFETLRLPREQELSKANELDLVRQLAPRLIQRSRGAPDQLDGPLEIVGAFVLVFQRAEQGVVVQPEPLGLTELFISGSEIRTGAGAEATPRCLEHAKLERNDLLVFDGGRRKCMARAIGRPQQSVLDQAVGAYQQPIAGERR